MNWTQGICCAIWLCSLNKFFLIFHKQDFEITIDMKKIIKLHKGGKVPTDTKSWFRGICLSFNNNQYAGHIFIIIDMPPSYVVPCKKTSFKASHNPECIYSTTIPTDSLNAMYCVWIHTHTVSHMVLPSNHASLMKLQTVVQYQSAKGSSPLAGGISKFSCFPYQPSVSSSTINLVAMIIYVTDVKWRDVSFSQGVIIYLFYVHLFSHI